MDFPFLPLHKMGEAVLGYLTSVADDDRLFWKLKIYNKLLLNINYFDFLMYHIKRKEKKRKAIINVHLDLASKFHQYIVCESNIDRLS